MSAILEFFASALESVSFSPFPGWSETTAFDRTTVEVLARTPSAPLSVMVLPLISANPPEIRIPLSFWPEISLPSRTYTTESVAFTPSPSFPVRSVARMSAVESVTLIPSVG